MWSFSLFFEIEATKVSFSSRKNTFYGEKNMFSPRTQWVLNKLDGFNGIQFAKHILETQGHICHLSRPTDYLFYLSFSLQDEIDSHQIVNSIHNHLSDNDQLYFNAGIFVESTGWISDGWKIHLIEIFIWLKSHLVDCFSVEWMS